MSGVIRVGIGGWDFAPWRQTFYPGDVTQKRQLEYASRQVTSIEVNGTFYRLQSAAVYAKWRDETPEDFVFSLKAPRFVTHRRELATAGNSIQRFIGSGIEALGTKLGPLLWQLPPTTHFDADDVGAFLQLLPAQIGDVVLRHALEVRHTSFVDAAFIALARRSNVAIVLADSPKYPAIAALTADFTYARLMNSIASCRTGYTTQDLAAWKARAQTMAQGKLPADLPTSDTVVPQRPAPTDVFVYFINGAKERAPAAAMHLLADLRGVAIESSDQPEPEPIQPLPRRATVKRASRKKTAAVASRKRD